MNSKKYYRGIRGADAIQAFKYNDGSFGDNNSSNYPDEYPTELSSWWNTLLKGWKQLLLFLEVIVMVIVMLYIRSLQLQIAESE
jgi:hypothetical protein